MRLGRGDASLWRGERYSDAPNMACIAGVGSPRNLFHEYGYDEPRVRPGRHVYEVCPYGAAPL